MSGFNVRKHFLDGLTPSERESVIDSATRRHFPAKSVIVQQGDPANRLFLLTKGRAQCHLIQQDGTKSVLFWMPPGLVLGAATLCSDAARYLVTAEAVKTSSSLVWDSITIRALAKRYPQILTNTISGAFDFVEWCCTKHCEQMTQGAPQRLSQVLESLGRVMGRQVREGVEIEAINEHLASAAHITQFTVSRLLNQWQRDGVITKRRGKVVLHSLDALASSFA